MSPPGGQPELNGAKIIFVAPICDGLGFALVEYPDGRLDILRNGVTIANNPWPASEVADCVITFQKVSRLAAQAEAAPASSADARRR